MDQPRQPLARAWVATLAGTTVNLCLGILYAWSVWKARLLAGPDRPSGSPMAGLDVGWVYLTDAQATVAYATCGMVFALGMIPGGRLQDRYGPRVGATVGGLFLGVGCVLAGMLRSYAGLVLGFGVLGGLGMGFGYAAATPAAVRWFGPHRRGLVVGLVVAGYGGAAVYIAPLAQALIAGVGLSGSFVALGVLFAGVVAAAARLLVPPPPGYTPPPPPGAPAATGFRVDWSPREALGTWQFYALVALLAGSAQAGLLVIANAAPMLTRTAGTTGVLAGHGWLLAAFGGVVNAAGRVGTGAYSDRLGRPTAYLLNGLAAAVCLAATPAVMHTGSVPLLFLVVGVAFWQYGGGLALVPALTADYFGARHLGAVYGFVFLGWGAAFLVPLLAGVIKDATGSLDVAFYLSVGVLVGAVGLSRLLRRPVHPKERGTD